MNIISYLLERDGPTDDQSNGQGQAPATPGLLVAIGLFLLALAAWDLWSAIDGGDWAHWVVFVLLVAGGGSALVVGVSRLRRRSP